MIAELDIGKELLHHIVDHPWPGYNVHLFGMEVTWMSAGISAMLIAVGVGIPLGVAAAKRQYSLFDNFATVASLIGISIPIFFLGLLLQYVFGVWLHWLPTAGRYDLGTFSYDHAGTNFLLW